MARRDTGRGFSRRGASPGLSTSASAKEESLVLTRTTTTAKKPVADSVVARDAASAARRRLRSEATLEAPARGVLHASQTRAVRHLSPRMDPPKTIDPPSFSVRHTSFTIGCSLPLLRALGGFRFSRPRRIEQEEKSTERATCSHENAK